MWIRKMCSKEKMWLSKLGALDFRLPWSPVQDTTSGAVCGGHASGTEPGDGAGSSVCPA